MFLDKIKSNVDQNSRKKKKKIDIEEEKLTQINNQLNWTKMKSMFLIGIVFTILLRIFGNKFSGKIIAKLTFIPFSFIQGVSHRGLEGNDMTDCSFFFFYIMCTMFLKQVCFNCYQRKV
ncbi:Transmembrane and coiled-coil domain-containing protein 1 [Intoshia linei]|uniref:Transmembrane and coiled-coil domain-containing protein 1 n=1 Tax=Intoshia linei TaxID=1819745 RepID=A0A177B7S3_9BILA|nr:Transmembrane and coiled-coil domain-containing protein 1 [Intoshia linei]